VSSFTFELRSLSHQWQVSQPKCVNARDSEGRTGSHAAFSGVWYARHRADSSLVPALHLAVANNNIGIVDILVALISFCA
jgi:hypothetical protein